MHILNFFLPPSGNTDSGSLGTVTQSVSGIENINQSQSVNNQLGFFAHASQQGQNTLINKNQGRTGTCNLTKKLLNEIYE
jgi:hypothetical protein